MTEFFYRVEESRWTEEDGHKDIYIRAFPVIRTTPCGVWLNTSKWSEECPKKFQKFVLRKNGKWAQPTIALAKAMFKARKKVHIRMMKWRLEVIERVYERALKDDFQPVNLDKVNELVDNYRIEKAIDPTRDFAAYLGIEREKESF